MTTKSIFASKTFWLNILTLAGLVIGYLITSGTLSKEVLTGLTTVNGVLNIIVRFYTGTPIAGSPADPNK